jgi:type IV secretory pathway VirB9-like protein
LGAYIRHVRFYYPDAMVQAWSTTTAVAAAPPTGVTAVSSAQGPSAARVDAFNFEYRLHRDHGFPWSPLAVFDDGAHCYIKLPPLAAHRDEPVLFLLRDDGTKALMNYSVSGDTYVSDRVFRAAVLVIGEASQERTLRIENLRYEAPPSLEPEVKGDAAGAPQPNGGPHE